MQTVRDYYVFTFVVMFMSKLRIILQCDSVQLLKTDYFICVYVEMILSAVLTAVETAKQNGPKGGSGGLRHLVRRQLVGRCTPKVHRYKRIHKVHWVHRHKINGLWV